MERVSEIVVSARIALVALDRPPGAVLRFLNSAQLAQNCRQVAKCWPRASVSPQPLVTAFLRFEKSLLTEQYCSQAGMGGCQIWVETGCLSIAPNRFD